MTHFLADQEVFIISHLQVHYSLYFEMTVWSIELEEISITKILCIERESEGNGRLYQMFSVAECNLGLRWPCTGVCLYGLSCRSLCMAFHLHLSLPTLLAIVECLFAPTAPTISCLHRVTVVITWVGKYFHWFISVMEADGCRFQGCHGYLHAFLSSRTTPPNPRHLPQAHPLAMSLI